MKKIILLFGVLLPTVIYSQDACYNVYKTALQEFNKGNYAEAQRKFLVVAKTCGDYSDVWKKLKDCNQKLADIQALQVTEITSLKAGKKKLTEDVEHEKEKNSKQTVELSKAAVQLQALKNDTVRKNKEITEGKKQLSELQNKVSNMQHAKDSIQATLDSALVQISILQEEINNYSKKKENSKKNEKKASDAKKQPHITDTTSSDTIKVSK